MRSTIGSFGPFSQPSVWDQPPLRHSSATHSAQMQQCRRACANHRGPATPLANSQLSTHDRLSGTHRVADQGLYQAKRAGRNRTHRPTDVHQVDTLSQADP